jgi:hypothetical protein
MDSPTKIIASRVMPKPAHKTFMSSFGRDMALGGVAGKSSSIPLAPA